MSESDGVSDGAGSRQTLFFCLFKGPTGFGFSGLFYLLFLSCFNNFFQGELLIFFAIPPRGFGFGFRLGTGLISDDRRTLAEVNGEKLAVLNDG